MAGSAFLTNCGFFATAGGTADWVVGNAAPTYSSDTSAGATNAVQYTVRAQSIDGSNQWEVSQGNYTSGTRTFARTTVLYNSSGTGTGPGQTGAGTKINFNNIPLIAVVDAAEDLLTANITKAIQQTGTNSVAGVTPARQQDHDSALKAWVMFTGSAVNGAQTVNASYNVTGVSRTSIGIYVITFTTAFATTSYVGTITNNGGVTDGFGEFITQATGTITGVFLAKATGALFDPVSGAYCMFAGRQ